MTDITSYIGTFCESKNNWTKRFAGIANKALFVYKTDGTDDSEVLNIELPNAISFGTIQGSTLNLPLNVKDRRFGFFIQDKQKKIHYFDCRTEDVLHCWVENIKKYLNVNALRTIKQGNSSIVESLRLWKDSAIYTELIESLSKVSIKQVSDLESLPLSSNVLFETFVKNNTEKINDILKNKPEKSHIAYILLDFIQYVPSTQFSSTKSQDSIPQKPRRLRPKKNMKKLINKLAKSASGRNVFNMEVKSTTPSSPLVENVFEESDAEYAEPESDTQINEETNQESTQENQELEDNPESEQNGEQDDELIQPKLDFDLIAKRRGILLSNPYLVNVLPSLPSKSSKPAITGLESSDSITSGSIEIESQQLESQSIESQQIEDSQPIQDVSSKQRMVRKKRRAPTKTNITELISTAEIERGTLTEIKKLEEETVIEKVAPSSRIPGGLPMMGIALPTGDLRSVLKKNSAPPPLPKREEQPPVQDYRSVLKNRSIDNTDPSPLPKKEEQPPVQDYRSVLKNRSNTQSVSTNSDASDSPPATPSRIRAMLESKAVPLSPSQISSPKVPNRASLSIDQIQPISPTFEKVESNSPIQTNEISEEKKEDTATSKVESTNIETVDESNLESKEEISNDNEESDNTSEAKLERNRSLKSIIEKQIADGAFKMASPTGGPVLKMEIQNNNDFRSVLKKRSDPSTPSKKEEEPKQFDFRSVLKKSQPPPNVKKDEEPKQFDFRSVLRKTNQTEDKK